MRPFPANAVAQRFYGQHKNKVHFFELSIVVMRCLPYISQLHIEVLYWFYLVLKLLVNKIHVCIQKVFRVACGISFNIL